MKVHIKDWNDAVKAAIADDEDWNVKNDSIFGISDKYGAWGEVIEGYKDGKYFCDGHYFAYPLCVVDKIEDDNESVNPDALLRYGKVVIDDQMHTTNVDVDRRLVIGDVRIRLIEFDGLLFYHKMANGDVVDCRCVGMTNA